MTRDDGYTRYTVRIPTPLYERLKEAAGEKSVNAEIVERLAQSFGDASRTLGLEEQMVATNQQMDRLQAIVVDLVRQLTHLETYGIKLADREEKVLHTRDE